MKIAFMQVAPLLGNQAANVEAIERLWPQCTAADLVVLPELCSTGYCFESREQAWELSETVDDNSFLKFIHGLCRQKDQFIVSGFLEREGDKLYNSAALVGPEGVMGTYRKIHLFLNEKDIFEPGNSGLPVFDVRGVKVGILICFDWMFPEVWRVLALRGADVICHPSNLVIPEKAQRAVPIQALLNGVFVVTANRYGIERDVTFTGSSLICGPDGEVLAQAEADSDAVAGVEIDPAAARDKSITARNDRLKDRRPEEYQRICASH